MTKLITMQGRAKLGHEFSLLKLTGNNTGGLENVDPWTLSDQEAGVQLLYILEKNNPGMTWGDFFKCAFDDKIDPVAMGFNPFKNLGRKIKNLTVDTVNFIGAKSGSAIRLLTDKQVRDGLMQYGAAYASGGASMGAQGLFDQLLNPEAAAGLLGKLGQQNKINYASAGGLGNINPMYLMGGAGLLILVVLLSGGRR